MNLDLVNSVSSFIPEIVLILIIILIPLNKVFFSKIGIRSWQIAIYGFGISIIFSVIQVFSLPTRIFGAMSVLDPLSAFANIAITFSTLLILLITAKHDAEESFETEYFVFITSAALGCMLLASSVNLAMLIVSAALIDMSLALLMSLKYSGAQSGSQNIKLFTFNIMTSALMLVGVSLLYGISGSMDYYSISIFLSVHPFNTTTLLLAVLLILTGFASKMLLIPFHLPDTKTADSNPISIYAMIFCPVIISAFIAAARFFITIFQSAHLVDSSSLNYTQIPNFYWNMILIVLSLIAIAFSSLAIIYQFRLRKIILYFTVIQSSLYLFGLATVSKSGLSSSLGLAIAFCILFPGLLYCLHRIETEFKTDDIYKLTGKGHKNKWVFTGLIILSASLAGLPVTVGFTSRLFLYNALAAYASIWIIVISILNSLILLFVCLKIYSNVFLREDQDFEQISSDSRGEKLILLIILIPAILTGFYFGPIVKIAEFFIQMYGIR